MLNRLLDYLEFLLLIGEKTVDAQTKKELMESFELKSSIGDNISDHRDKVATLINQQSNPLFYDQE